MIFLFWVLEWPFYILGINPHKKGSAPVGLAIGGLWGHTLCVACQLPISKGGGESKAESRSSGDSSQWSEKLCKTYAVCKTPVFFRKNKTYIHIPFYTLGLIWFDDHFPMIHDGIPALKRTVFHSMTTSRVTSAALRLWQLKMAPRDFVGSPNYELYGCV
jgi:hypothetical protein